MPTLNPPELASVRGVCRLVRLRLGIFVLGSSLFVGLLSCAQPEPSPRAVRVLVQDDQQRPIPEVSFELDGLTAGKTGADGSANVSLAVHGPVRARIGVSCPVSMRPAEPRQVARHQQGGSARLELTFTCRPKLRTLAVVARIPGGEGLVLRADGDPVGTLASDGTLHAILQRAPDSELRLLLDTSGTALLPANPMRELRVADRDEIVVFDQVLNAPAKPGRPRGTPAPRAAPVDPPKPARDLPYAIR